MVYRQGDVAFVPVQGLPANAKQVKRTAPRLVLALGEVTGHAHAVEAGAAVMYADPQLLPEPLSAADQAELLVEQLFEMTKGRYIESDVEFTVIHEEHGAITMAPGTYEVRIATEYTPQGIVRVFD